MQDSDKDKISNQINNDSEKKISKGERLLVSFFTPFHKIFNF